jgi:hypothetical protein
MCFFFWHKMYSFALLNEYLESTNVNIDEFDVILLHH